MKTHILLLVFILCVSTAATAQTKVAGYAYGNPGTDQYEQLGFWVKDGKRTDIYYAYGRNTKEVKLRYLGKDRMKGSPCFKVQFSNNYVLYVIPIGEKLKVVDAAGKYLKTFSWQYEGPVNGIGTYCSVCAADDDEAMSLIQTYYLD